MTAAVDLDAIRAYRERWSVFRDRRPDAYGTLLTLGAETVGSEKAAPNSQAGVIVTPKPTA